jgi:hypothetical protein
MGFIFRGIFSGLFLESAHRKARKMLDASRIMSNLFHTIAWEAKNKNSEKYEELLMIVHEATNNANIKDTAEQLKQWFEENK